jgi:regulatory protein
MIDPDLGRKSGESEIMSVVMRRLNAAPRSRGELSKYLLDKEFDPTLIERVLDRVSSMGYIDDVGYAQEWVRSRHRSRGLAPSVLKRELISKDVDLEVIEAALEQLTSDETRVRAYELAAKKYRSLMSVDHAVAVRRIASLLQRKGYPPSMCFQVAKETVGAELDADGELGR